MLKTVLWIAAACAAVLLALAVSRMIRVDAPARAPAAIAEPVVEAPAPITPPPPPVAKPVATPEEVQIQEDAAATGMTTIEPETPPSDTPVPN